MQTRLRRCGRNDELLLFSPGYTLTVRDDDPSWNKQADVTLFLFADFTDITLASVDLLLKSIYTVHSVRVVWKHNPTGRHPQSLMAALALEAARNQNRFWSMREELLNNRARLFAEPPGSESLFIDLAADLRLDVRAFRRDMRGAAALARVQDDLRQARRTGAFGVAVRVQYAPGSGADTAPLRQELAEFLYSWLPAEKVYGL